MKRAIVTMSIFLGLGMSAATAADYPTKAFDVTYTCTTPQGQSTMRMISDGKGKVRTESSSGGQTVISIADYPAKVAYTVIDQMKMVFKSPIKTDQGYVGDSESAKKRNAKSLGKKVVQGHPCTGWEYTVPGGKSEVWTADDIGCFVESTTVADKAGKTVTAMKSYNPGAPKAELFNLPAGYKVMENPAQGMTAGGQ